MIGNLERGRKPLRAVAGAVVMSALMSFVGSCTSSTPESATSTTTTTSNGGGPGGGKKSAGGDSWVGDSLRPHSRLSSTKDSIVYAGVEGKKLYVVALDPTTGTERWRRLSDVGSRIRGVELNIHTDDDSAYFLVPGNAPAEGKSSQVAYLEGPAVLGQEQSQSPSLVAVATATGEERWRKRLSGRANPNATKCGDGVCLVVETYGQELWRFSRATGDDLGRNSISAPSGPGDDAPLASGPDGDTSKLLMASRGPVYITQFTDGHADWSKSSREVFGQLDVTPDGGWAGWPVDGGWIGWLGPHVERGSPPKPGDVLSSGAMVGLASDGTVRWTRADRHPCVFVLEQKPTFCDGEWHVTGPEKAELRPNLLEGRDPVTGAVQWKVELGGTVNEFESSKQVLRVDDTTILLDLPTGSELVDVVTGPKPGADANVIGWCPPADMSAHDSIEVGNRTADYVRARAPAPCKLGGEPVTPKVPVPEFAGVNVSGWSAWIEKGDVHAKKSN